jgi:hypothetical protein
MTESTVTPKKVLQDLQDSLAQLISDAENRRKAASAKNENYKIEFSAGEKHAYEGIAKTLKVSIDSI